MKEFNIIFLIIRLFLAIMTSKVLGLITSSTHRLELAEKKHLIDTALFDRTAEVLLRHHAFQQYIFKTQKPRGSIV